MTDENLTVLSWYKQLAPRTVDLVGDFVGRELFIIEGDSLLLECFSNEKLDFSLGFQLLHATYLVEKLLQKLRQRKCVFDVVFFAKNSRLCIPANTKSHLESRYLLAREVIIQHLARVSIESSYSFGMKNFNCLQDQAFAEYLADSGVYLFVCHDGALADRATDDNPSEEDDSVASSDDEEDSERDENGPQGFSCQSTLELRRMMHWVCAFGCNISLISSLEFRDTKVMSTVIEGAFDRTSASHFQVTMSISKFDSKVTKTDYTLAASALKQMDNFLGKAIEMRPDLTQRQCLSVVTLCVILSDEATSHAEIIPEAMALIMHLVILQSIKIEERALVAPEVVGSAFLDIYFRTATAILSSENWKEMMNRSTLPCDLCDMIDGRLFFEAKRVIERVGINRALSPATISPFNELTSLVDNLCGAKLQATLIAGKEAGTENLALGKDSMVEQYSSEPTHKSPGLTAVLPFKNRIFDRHLQPVQITVDPSLSPEHSIQPFEHFTEKTHWHRPRPLDPKKCNPSVPESRYLRRNQFHMAEMQRYAESLLGSTRISEPEVIVVDLGSKPRQKSSGTKDISHSRSNDASDRVSNSLSVRQRAAMTIKQNVKVEEKKKLKRWEFKLQEFEKVLDPISRLNNVEDYYLKLPTDSRIILESEILAYMLETLLHAMFGGKREQETSKHMFFMAHIWGIITRLMRIKQGVSTSVHKFVENVCQCLDLPEVRLQIGAQNDQPLSFKPSARIRPPESVFRLSKVEFQLQYGGPFMERNICSSPDTRTPDFEPDLWQKQVLDQIDAKKSAFIVAPTSAGKTFISFYAMKQVLREDNDGVLVYVAPTKALVNQIAAEIQTKFRKEYPLKSMTRSIWAIHTRDYRINNPAGCQILVTVPHILQIMLLSPSKANEWTPRLRRIIFDEIHCIGQADDGVVWEQLLLLSPCPVIALSATVGNPQEFHAWLKYTQGVNGHDLKMIQYQHRYSDLRKYLYCPDRSFHFKGLQKSAALPLLGLDEAPGMSFLHPVSSLVDRSRGIPEDLSLEPRDCLSLWQAMHDIQTDSFPVDPSLSPHVLFSNHIIRKIDVTEWQKGLMQLLEKWMKDRQSPFDTLLQNLKLENKTIPPFDDKDEVSSRDTPQSKDSLVQRAEILATTLPLICSLHAQGALPAIFFNYDRSMCEEICHNLLCQLQQAEIQWKSESLKWKAKLDEWEKWKKAKEHEKKRSVKSSKRKGAEDNVAMSRAEQLRESASAESDSMAKFDPKRPLEKFNLADPKKLTGSEFQHYVDELKFRDISTWLIDALERGIGVHHAGLNRKYRQVCEILFRKGFLRVVVATGTLALGINMPCKTVVFSGDSIYLTALNFRQASGRAGRRGFDLLGNVVFQNVPVSKVHRLISSRLPDLNGQFPITTSLVLRLFILLHGSKEAESAVKSVASLLSSSRICLGGPEMKQTLLHFLRFSIEYLRRNNLLDATGGPLNFAGCISHLYYTESSSFAFHALLSNGYFGRLCRNFNLHPKATLKKLMLVMSHIFGRFPLHRSIFESHFSADKRSSSLVVLPPLPRPAAKVLMDHNQQVLDIYTGYVSAYIDQHVQKRDCYLPMSRRQVGGEKSASELGLGSYLNHSSAPVVTSSFYALSGQTDDWSSVSDLCEMVRSEVWLEESVIPYVPVTSNQHPLNAYLYDFFKHGNVQQLEKANGIRRNDIWYRLNDFSMVLATLITSLGNFLSSKPSSDPDMLDVAGCGDSVEIEVDDKIAEKEGRPDNATSNIQSDGGQKRPGAKPSISKKRNRILQKEPIDNWEDEALNETRESVADQTPQFFPPGKTEKNEPNCDGPPKKIDDCQSRQSLIMVFKAFSALKTGFDEKFKKMWA